MKLETVDIRQAASAADIVYEALRKAIIEGDLAEGENLRQDQIALMFNTSRIPVREALSRLEQNGLITTQRYKGAVVAGLSIEEIEEIFEFRALIEAEVIRLAVPKLTGKTLDAARRHCQAFDSEANSAMWGEINRNFHYSLYEAARRPYYLQIVRASLDRIDRYLRAQLTLTNGMSRARREHKGILDACIAGDADKAAELTRDHILGAGRALVTFLEETRGRND
ncbi:MULTISPECIES: GntR family transcriptional regulator [Aminobacter]|nr:MULTISPECIES: GntR family transcriptional regulator [Aminobacter]MBA8906930.1 DNA-binding GntR family transcriptional regulator [Aminobacter ciceronei]MBA9020812.1 DNA-binding GntR family transcriptional regulator [Aminobacter ciceronei]MBB3708371.1 DNA-binding GntR family transcriptional regulator [Aminobacter aminovorans]MRX32164.1 FCD domain-containing protein [Aminobacter sp. MDW-2]QNH37565.1 GntR family transcriptional regulator [Aminobacter sp. MDW-2]